MEREQPALVFQQDGPFDGHLLHDGRVAGVVPSPDRVRVLVGSEQACVEHRRQHPLDHVVQVGTRQLARYRLVHAGSELGAPRHLDVFPGLSGRYCRMGSAPVGSHQALEAELAVKLAEQVLLLAHGHPLGKAVGAHDGAGASFDRGLKRGHVNFLLRPLGHYVAVARVVAVSFLVVDGILFDHGDHALGLDPLHVGCCHLAAEVGILP